MPKKNRPNKEQDKLRQWAKYSSMGFQMLTIMLMGVFGGHKLDEIIHTSKPYFTIILTIIAVILAVYYTIKDLIRMK